MNNLAINYVDIFYAYVNLIMIISNLKFITLYFTFVERMWDDFWNAWDESESRNACAISYLVY